MARVYDLQHEHADEMLAPSPDDGRLVNVTHLIPRCRERPRAPPPRDRADRRPHRRHDGPHARLPERHVRLLRRPRRRVGAPRQRAGRRQPGRLPEADARPRPLHHPLDHEPAGRSQQAGGRAGGGRGRAAQGGRDREPHHRARRPHAGHARPLRRRADHLSRLRHPPPGRRLRARVRAADGHARPALHLPRQLLQAALHVRLPAVVAVRRDGRRRHLRQRRGAEGPAVPVR